MQVNGIQKLGLIRELKKVRGYLTTEKGVNKLTLVKRLAEIRVLLSGEGLSLPEIRGYIKNWSPVGGYTVDKISIKSVNWYPSKKYLPADYLESPSCQYWIERIKSGGSMLPIIVDPKDDEGIYFIRDGIHRFAASEYCGLQYLPAIIAREPDSGMVRKFTEFSSSEIESIISEVKEISVEKAAGLALDLTDKAACLASIKNYFDGEFKNLPKALQATEASTLMSVHALVNSLHGDAVVSVSDFNAIQAVAGIKPEESAFTHYSKSGTAFETESGYVQVMMEHLEQVKNEPEIDAPGVNMRKAEIQDLIDKGQLNRREFISQKSDSVGRMDSDEYGRYSVELDAMYGKIMELKNLYNSLDVQKYRDKEEKITAIREKLKEPGQLIINTLLSASTVTQEQADQWAKDQIIDKTSSAKLSKNGYKTADVRRDMAEFYRITGGKLRNIAIVSNGSRRANASGIGQAEGMEVRATSNFSKVTLWHELAHHLEADPAAKQAANDFLIKRRESETVYSLRSLTGIKGYGKDEGAYKDTFITPYIGKVYRGQVTEVWSMGVQYLSDPEQAAMFIAKDPEMASLIAGYLQAELTPAMQALQQVQGMTAGGNQAKRDDAENQYQDAVKRLAADVEIVDDGWFETMSDDFKSTLLGMYGLNDKNAKYLGSWKQYKVFSGKFKNKKTKRVGNGYSIVNVPAGDNLYNSFSNFPIIEELPVVRAVLKITSYEGSSVSTVYYNKFIFATDHTRFVHAANQIIGVPG